MNIYNFIKDIAPLIVAIVVCVIVYRQYRNDLRSTRLSLYDRRYKVYLETLSFLRDIVHSPEASEKAPELAEIYFLFEHDIYNHIHGLILDAMKYKSLGNELKRLGRSTDNNSEYEAVVIKQDKYYRKFVHELENVEEMFMPYLDFRKAEPDTLHLSYYRLRLRMYFQHFTNKFVLFGIKVIAPVLYIGHVFAVLWNKIFRRTKQELQSNE